VFKALVEDGKVRTTHAARTGANELRRALSDMLAVVMSLTPVDFYKSMNMAGRLPPEYAGGRRVPKTNGIDGVLIVYFKKLRP
jgi:motility quorum-sensing regulator/GCU-specific mRNA interferase toxin